jgi:hypothetical protein
MKTTYLAVAETAKLIRAQLKTAFPAVKFSVRSSSYSGGCSVNVKWTDGPTVDEVEPVAKMFQGRRFDGMIDMGWNASLWLLPDGTATVASDPGSTGSAGVFAAERNWMPHPDAKLISTGAFVFCDRDTSADLRSRVRAFVRRRGGWQMVRRAQDEDQAVYMVAHRAKVAAGCLLVRKDAGGWL